MCHGGFRGVNAVVIACPNSLTSWLCVDLFRSMLPIVVLGHTFYSPVYHYTDLEYIIYCSNKCFMAIPFSSPIGVFDHTYTSPECHNTDLECIIYYFNKSFMVIPSSLPAY